MGNNPYHPEPHSADQSHQGKLVLGSFNEPQHHHRGQAPAHSDQLASQPTSYPNQHRQRHQEPPVRHAQSSRPVPDHPHRPATPGPTPYGRPQARPRRRNTRLIVSVSILLVLCVVGITFISMFQKAMTLGSAISTQSPLSTQTGYMTTGDRTNLLVLGYGGGDHDGANLTDSMAVISMLPQNQHTTMIAVPRDLEVKTPDGGTGRINSIYSLNSNNGKDMNTGADAAAKKVASVTGMDVKYWMLIDFQGFRQLINSLGGIDVYVPNSFTSLYPKNDDPKIDPNYITIHFDKGMQHMDGETAIRYSRARKVTDNLAEGTDFARSARQQIIVKTTLAKIKSPSNWSRILDSTDAFKGAIHTNMSLADLGLFSLKMDTNHAHQIGLSNENVLTDLNDDNGAVLTPKTSWQDVANYVQSQLYN